MLRVKVAAPTPIWIVHGKSRHVQHTVQKSRDTKVSRQSLLHSACTVVRLIGVVLGSIVNVTDPVIGVLPLAFSLCFLVLAYWCSLLPSLRCFQKVLLCFDTQAARLLSSLMCNSNADGFQCPAALTHVAASRRPFLGAIEKDPVVKRASRSARPHLMVGFSNWGKVGPRAYMKPVLPKRSHDTLCIYDFSAPHVGHLVFLWQYGAVQWCQTGWLHSLLVLEL